MWKDLTINQKSQLMSMFLREGIDNINTMMTIYDSMPDNSDYRNGGGIHIKKENRGKFNELLERTGKSASWFKKHGTPLQKKRATFALNARKWQHADGGSLDNIFSEINNSNGTYDENSMIEPPINNKPWESSNYNNNEINEDTIIEDISTENMNYIDSLSEDELTSLLANL